MKFLALIVLFSAIISVQLKEQISKASTGAKIKSVSASSTYSKSSFAQLPEQQQEDLLTEKDLCLKNEKCEECAIEWGCSYGVESEENLQKEKECFDYCIQQNKDADLHDKIIKAKGTERKE